MFLGLSGSLLFIYLCNLNTIISAIISVTFFARGGTH